MKRIRLEVIVPVLALLSLALVLWHEWGMDQSLYVRPVPQNTFVDTDSIDGGHTHAGVEWTDSSAILRYELVAGAAYPYAGLRVSLAKNDSQGVDFSRYDSILVHIRTMPGRYMRVYLRNWNAAYSEAGKPLSLKFNELEYCPSEEPYPARFVPGELRVASWWASQFKVNVHEAALDISNVPLIEIQTGSGEALGKGWFEVEGIEFKGKRITAERLYLGILLVWLLFIAVWTARRLWNMSVRVKKEHNERLKLARLHELLEIQAKDYERMAKNDALTGALNRNGMRDILMRELDEARKHGTALSFIMIDIDHFKSINDTLGHPVGDEALQRVSAIAAANIRTSDALVRWGGEEFVILCPGTPVENAGRLAEKLRARIAGTQILEKRTVTCSFGVVELNQSEAVESAFARMDEALYEAKRGGRNRVVLK
jgi:diguanylate cyclase (GGDEF)-like protein